MRDTPQAGQVYRHFKGDLYKIIGVTEASGFKPDYEAPHFWAEHSELRTLLGIWNTDGDRLFATEGPEPSFVEEKLVIYCLHLDGESNCAGRVWARPLHNFLETLGDPDEGTQFYRFELVREAATNG